MNAPRYNVYSEIAQLPTNGIHDICVAIGVFDAVHLGHQAIIRELISRARAYQATPVVITFDPLPPTIVNPELGVRRLLTLEHRYKLLSELGVEAIVCLPFTAEFAQRSPDEFCMDLFECPGLAVKALCVGRRWRFGAGASGDIEFLSRFIQQRQKSVEIVAIPELYRDHERISTTRIRNSIARGDFVCAKKLLGREYSLWGPVSKGRGIAGNVLHYPTANLDVSGMVVPPAGIYAGKACLQGKSLPGIIYLGSSPTFNQNESDPILEIHLFDFSQQIYGQYIEVFFLKFIREERKFPSAAMLIRQIEQDIFEAKRYHQQQGDSAHGLS
ncbi:MAG: riboflavin biosynthesis protein RibF [Lentisphaerae bacterium]|nr:MAG: riboflavin biosynthesis protein RibF [Lentisphaerota bacterium]